MDIEKLKEQVNLQEELVTLAQKSFSREDWLALQEWIHDRLAKQYRRTDPQANIERELYDHDIESWIAD